MKVMLALLGAILMLPVCATATVAATDDKQPGASISDDVIARVGDQTITFSEINVALNSSAIVGVSMPALGTPERDTARITLLDRFVSANLLYLDALKQGVDKNPGYRKTITRFSNAILAGLYRQHNQGGDIPVSDEEVQRYHRQHMSPDTEMTADVHLQIETALRRQKLHEKLAQANKTLRDNIQIVVHKENLDIKGDDKRPDTAPLAEVGTETITWGQIGDRIIAAGKGATMADPLAFETQARRDALENEIDLRIMVQKAKAAGLEDNPLYRKRMREYSKTLLTNLHREQLVKQMEPSEQELKAYYEANRKRFVLPEARKLQMIVVGTKAEAGTLKKKIEAGEMTMYQAARDHSIAANAGKNLGDVGWVNQGEMTPELDKTIFSLEPGKIGGPVESPAGWHLVTALDVRDAAYTDFAEETTRRLTRRQFLHEKLDAYTTSLRMEQFPVEVYQERLVQLAQQEADMVKALAQKSKTPGSVTQQRIEEMKKIMKPPL